MCRWPISVGANFPCLAPPGLAAGQSADAMAYQTAMQCTASQLGEGFTQMPLQVVQGKQSAAPELDHHRPSASESRTLHGLVGPIGLSVVVERERHLATVLTFSP